MKSDITEGKRYTLTLSSGDANNHRIIHIPSRYLRYSTVAICFIVVCLSMFFIDYRSAVKQTVLYKQEIQNLQQINDFQSGQIKELAKTTTVLQKDIDRLNNLDAEIRHLFNNESNVTSVSRAAVSRLSHNSGQGGPSVQPSLTEIMSTVSQLQTIVPIREESLLELKDALIERNAKRAATPSMMPAAGEITSRFGWRSSPWGGDGSDWHPGIDIANDYGTPIYATAAGNVAFSGWFGGYGKLVKLDHGNGIESLYGHNSLNLVDEGEWVQKGQIIAYMGSTGNSTGSHVHYEIRVNNNAVNPAKFL
ncbi:M23 family metallopeptidase [Dendrosporobacter sp. 1207_IL3150]|uniref:M23 family metallopeptidase n=1 Tax=Dendrosporobacter sp. 1207_IL3150 TaxID=3084054 RepID=UPI002FDB46D7